MAKPDYPLLTTKLFIPQPGAYFVERERLIERLNTGMDRRLTLISAPAGFGKTTLLSEWIARLQKPVSWISLDSDDNVPTQFLHYLIAALRAVNPTAGENALSRLQYSQRIEPAAIARTLLGELDVSGSEQLLVFDDYHAIETEEVHQITRLLLDYLPTRLHLVIATRMDPPLPIARLRSKGQLSELRTSDLSFTTAETTAFLNDRMGLQIPAGDIRSLESRTEGWIAGLQLAAISMQGRDDVAAFIATFAGDDRHIVDYLVEEVLEHQPPEIQQFLIRTSLLSRLSASLCDHVTGSEDGSRILQQLELSNLFLVPLDDKRIWYRYHHLFADLLRQRLQRGGMDRVKELHVRASNWFEDNGLIHDAIRHALAAGDYGCAARQIRAFVSRSWDYDSRMLEWHKKLPDELIRNDPELSFFSGWMLWEDGRYDAADEHLDIAEKLSTVSAPDQPDVSTELPGKIFAIRACIRHARGKIPETLQLAAKAEDLLTKSQSSWLALPIHLQALAYRALRKLDQALQKFRESADAARKRDDFLFYLLSVIRQVEIKRELGNIADALDTFEKLLRQANKSGFSRSPLLGWLYCSWGEVLADLNRMNEAKSLVQKGVDLSLQINESSMIGRSHSVLAGILLTMGDLAGAESVIRKVESLSEEIDVALFHLDRLEAVQVRIWLKKGKLEPAVDWMHSRIERSKDGFNFLSESEQVLFARIHLEQGDTQKALDLLRPLEKTPEVLLLQAGILHANGEAASSRSILKQALALTEKSGMVGCYVMEGRPAADLLQDLLENDKNAPRPYINKLLSAFQLNRLMTSNENEIVERLSERELEVLRFIAAGHSNQRIVEELFISLSTVKTHLRNIYGKLSVNSRTQATAKAKELGLL